MKSFNLSLLISLIFLLNCKAKPKKLYTVEEETGGILTCETIILRKDTVFKGEVFYGVLKPYHVIEYTSPVDGKIDYLAEGIVRRGQKLISISDSALLYRYDLINQKIQSLKLYIDKGFYKPEYFELLAERKKIEYMIDMTQFISPFSGVIEAYCMKGDVVKQGQKIFTLYQTDFLKVEIPLSEENTLYKEGTQAIITHNDIARTGIITGFSLDEEKNTMSLIIRVSNEDNRLKIGDFVRIKIVTDKKFGLILPNTALKQYGDKYVVFKLSGNRLIWKYVDVLLQDDKYSIISGDLEPHDTILAKDVDLATHNMICKKVLCSDTY
uniref:Efflux RND transporter periplasmic adaptor subunit n=1 Tax=candidate division WOR-3 bacterium TaxID=2052148 RepID=A0A7C2K6G0_UNCW3